MATNKPMVRGWIFDWSFRDTGGVRIHFSEPFDSPGIVIGTKEPLVSLSDYEALQTEFEEFKNKAHEWVRSGLELVNNAPRRFDFYYQKIEALRSDRDQQYDMKVKARAQRDEAARMLKAKEAESFALAAAACHGGYGDDFGHFRCNYQDEIRKLQAECEKLRKDAERYRWLREQCGSSGKLTIAKVSSWDLTGWSGDDPDSAIDAAMQESNHDK